MTDDTDEPSSLDEIVRERRDWAKGLVGDDPTARRSRAVLRTIADGLRDGADQCEAEARKLSLDHDTDPVTGMSVSALRDDAVWPEEGRKDDGGKHRIELVPPELIFGTAAVLTTGAVKYAARNWENGMSWGRVFGALMRHMWAWWAGKGPTTRSFLFGELDDETGHSHLWHAACCVAFLVAYEERGTGTDDRPRKTAQEKGPR